MYKKIQVEEYFWGSTLKSAMHGLDLNGIRVSMHKHVPQGVLEW